MSEWIDFRKVKPAGHTLAFVSNCKGWMYGVRALYDETCDVWRLYDPNYRDTLLLEVTHYLPIPEWVRE